MSERKFCGIVNAKVCFNKISTSIDLFISFSEQSLFYVDPSMQVIIQNDAFTLIKCEVCGA